ncbi:MAG: protein kinase [Firmicutes bacterium]|nr:protein kinase [Bacillota bacterium]
MTTWAIQEQKVAADGRRLYLVTDSQGGKYLWEPLNLTLSSKERLFVELLRELKSLINQPIDINGQLQLICYEGVDKYQDEYYLRIGYAEELWTNWPRKGEKRYALPEVATAALGLVEFTQTVFDMDCSFAGFFPGDLLPLGGESWGLLDPRVQKLLAPYRDGEAIREYYLPPEVIAGAEWTKKSYLYTVGLTLYTLATGVFPFPLTNRRETVTAILKEEPLDPRYCREEIGEEFAGLILKLMKKKEEDRPDIAEVTRELERMRMEQTLAAAPAEREKVKERAALMRRKVEQRRKRYWWWQRGKWPLAIAAVVLIFVILLSRGNYEEKITPETTPSEVVAVFYQGFAELDTMKLEEPLMKGVGQEFVKMVSFMHVTSKMRQAYEFIKVPFLVLEELKIEEDSASSPEKPVFHSTYRLKMLEGQNYQIQERRDRLVLTRWKKEWRIAELESIVLEEGMEPVMGFAPGDVLEEPTKP